MSDYEKLLSLINDERVQAGIDLNKDLGRTFTLGNTRHMWRHGTLSDGHEKVTPALRFFQANREIYMVSNSIEDARYMAMEAKADLIEAEQALYDARTESGKLRASATAGRAKARLRRALDQVQDSMRGLDELCKVRDELAPAILTQYPEGIEQAEPDNWKAVAEYRMLKQAGTRQIQPLDSIPLSPEHKAEIGFKHGRLDAVAPLALTDAKQCAIIENRLCAPRLEGRK